MEEVEIFNSELTLFMILHNHRAGILVWQSGWSCFSGNILQWLVFIIISIPFTLGETVKPVIYGVFLLCTKWGHYISNLSPAILCYCFQTRLFQLHRLLIINYFLYKFRLRQMYLEEHTYSRYFPMDTYLENCGRSAT